MCIPLDPTSCWVFFCLKENNSIKKVKTYYNTYVRKINYRNYIMNTYQTLLSIRNLSGTNDKLSFLKAQTSPLLERVLHMALSSEYTFGIKKIPSFTKEADSMSLTEALDIIEKSFCTNRVTGNSRSDLLSLILACVSPDDAEVVKMVISKKPDIGMNITGVNKCISKPIPTFATMLCAKQDQKLLDQLDWTNAVAQCKSDGMRIIISVDSNGKVRYRSRNGKEYFFSDKYNNFFSEYRNVVFDGEAVVKIDGVIQNRKTGNGIMNSIRQGTASPAENDQVHFILWDSIDYDSFMTGESPTPYLRRFELLNTIDANDSVWSPVETIRVTSFAQAEVFYKEMRSRGEEGAIIKDGNAGYQAKRVNHQIKMKAEETLDLRVIDMIEGTGKNKGRLGAITCVDKSGKLQVNVGSGFSDEQRDAFWNNTIVGQIVEVKYNEVIDSKGSDTLNLFLPIFVDLRDDKNDIDTVSL